MASSGEKLSDVESGKPLGKEEEETGFNGETERFLPNDDRKANGDIIEERAPDDDFYGLKREELEQYASDPKWVKVRKILFGIFVVCWAAMLIAAILIVVFSPKCPPRADLSWYQSGIMYKVNPEKFKDTTGDGVGDLGGIESRLDHFQDLSVESVWMVDVVSRSDFSAVRPELGSMDDFKGMAKAFKKNGIRVVISFPVDAVSPNSKLFKTDAVQFKKTPGTPADEWGESNGKYYRQDMAGQAVLNLESLSLLTSIDEAVRTWAKAGAEGFVVSLPKGSESKDTELVDRWQKILDEEFNRLDDRDRIVIVHQGVALPTKVKVTADSPTNCTDGDACAVKQLNTVVARADGKEPHENKPWNIVQLADTSSPLCSLTLRLTIPGTPNVIYGDEIGLVGGDIADRGYMKWDDTKNRGFTDKSNWNLTDSSKSTSSVLAQKSEGYFSVSPYRLFQQIAKIRTEPSLSWGATETKEFADGTIVFVRQAEKYEPVVVALNPTDTGKAGDLTVEKFTEGKILATNSEHLKVDDTISMQSVYLPANGVIIAKLSEPEK